MRKTSSYRARNYSRMNRRSWLGSQLASPFFLLLPLRRLYKELPSRADNDYDDDNDDEKYDHAGYEELKL